MQQVFHFEIWLIRCLWRVWPPDECKSNILRPFMWWSATNLFFIMLRHDFLRLPLNSCCLFVAWKWPIIILHITSLWLDCTCVWWGGPGSYLSADSWSVDALFSSRCRTSVSVESHLYKGCKRSDGCQGTTRVVVVSAYISAPAIQVGTRESWKHDARPAVPHVERSMSKRVRARKWPQCLTEFKHNM